jgi:hypothetical protein
VPSADHSWFPYDNTLDNLLHTVTTVTVSCDTEEELVSKSGGDDEEEAMDVGDGEENIVESMFPINRPRLDSRQGQSVLTSDTGELPSVIHVTSSVSFVWLLLACGGYLLGSVVRPRERVPSLNPPAIPLPRFVSSLPNPYPFSAL